MSSTVSPTVFKPVRNLKLKLIPLLGILLILIILGFVFFIKFQGNQNINPFQNTRQTNTQNPVSSTPTKTVDIINNTNQVQSLTSKINITSQDNNKIKGELVVTNTENRGFQDLYYSLSLFSPQTPSISIGNTTTPGTDKVDLLYQMSPISSIGPNKI